MPFMTRVLPNAPALNSDTHLLPCTPPLTASLNTPQSGTHGSLCLASLRAPRLADTPSFNPQLSSFADSANVSGDPLPCMGSLLGAGMDRVKSLFSWSLFLGGGGQQTQRMSVGEKSYGEDSPGGGEWLGDMVAFVFNKRWPRSYFDPVMFTLTPEVNEGVRHADLLEG